MPCALQGYRTHHVSNPQGAFGSWLTVPLFLLTWPVALLTGHFALTCAVFVGVYVATKLEPRAGAADGKLMVGLAAFAPLALGMGVLLEVAVFTALRLRGRALLRSRGVVALCRHPVECLPVRRNQVPSCLVGGMTTARTPVSPALN